MDGSAASFEDAFRAEYAGIVRVVAPIVGSVAEAEAVVQDAFAKAFARWRRIGRYDRPGAWIQRVAIRDAVRVVQRERRRPTTTAVEHDRLGAVPDHLDLHRAVAQLPAQQRACVVLAYLDDRPTTEVATLVGCSEATVRVHLHRARATLASALDPEELRDGR